MSASVNLATPSGDVHEYRQIVGSLQYLALTRPNVAYCVSKVSQFMHAPTTIHMQATKGLLRYLKSIGLWSPSPPLIGSSPNGLLWLWLLGWRFCWHEIHYYCIYCLPRTRCHFLVLQKAENHCQIICGGRYRTIGSITAEILWLKELFKDLRLTLPGKPHIYSATIGATYLCANPVFHTRMKHLAIDYHFVRDPVTNLQISSQSSLFNKTQVADIQDWGCFLHLHLVGACWHYPLKISLSLTTTRLNFNNILNWNS